MNTPKTLGPNEAIRQALAMDGRALHVAVDDIGAFEAALEARWGIVCESEGATARLATVEGWADQYGERASWVMVLHCDVEEP